MTDPPPGPLRLAVPHSRAQPDDTLRHALDDPRLAAVQVRGAALADLTALRALTATVHAAGSGLPRMVLVDPSDLADHPEMAPPDASFHAFELADGTEELEITLEVLDWGKRLAEVGIDLVLAPVLDGLPRAADLATRSRLAAVWTESLLAAGLVASAGPTPTPGADDDDWLPLRAGRSRGLEAVFLEPGPGLDATVRYLRDDQAFADVLISPRAADSAQAVEFVHLGCDLVRLGDAHQLAELPDEPGASATSACRLDRLVMDWFG